MRINIFVVCISLLLPIPASYGESQTPGGHASIVDLRDSPHGALHSVDLSSVRFTDGFWAQRYRQTHEVTLRRLWDLLADPNHGHILDNFRIAAGVQEGRFSGTKWQDAWLYKWIEAAACIYRTTGDPWIAARMDEAIALIGPAQQPDGYIHTRSTIDKRARWQDPRDHEAYVMGHLLTAACVHRRMTGQENFYRIAVRAADFLCETLGVTVTTSMAHNPTPVMGLVELYRETGERRYLEGAQRIVDGRGADPKPGGLFYVNRPGIPGTDYMQDRTPFRKETEVVGHNVFFTYLYAGVADLYLETGDETLKKTMDLLWGDLVNRKICITGGVSAMGRGLSKRGDPVVESVGKPYQLPNADAYNETCVQIGNLMWNYRLLSIDPEVRYADMMERELYNGFLGGIGIDGESWFYRNTLRRYDVDHKSLGHSDMVERGLPGHTRTCCPSNLLRALAQIQNYIYSVSAEGLWVHQYTGNKLDGTLADGSHLQLTQTTEYPWDGHITLQIDKVERTTPFVVALRIPGWAPDASLAINGQPASVHATSGQYVQIRRVWKAGDKIKLHLPMPVRLMQAHPKAEHLRNQVAVMRGPVLYCLESPDVPAHTDLNNVYVPSDIDLRTAPLNELAFGMTSLTGTALYRPEETWDTDLYRPLARPGFKPLPVRFIPYFAWNNRGPSAMTVWMPVVLKESLP